MPVSVASRTPTTFAPFKVTSPPASTLKVPALNVPPVWFIVVPDTRFSVPVPTSRSFPSSKALPASSVASLLLPVVTGAAMSRSPVVVSEIVPFVVVTPEIVVPATLMAATVIELGSLKAKSLSILAAMLSTSPAKGPPTSVAASIARSVKRTSADPPETSSVAPAERSAASPAAFAVASRMRLPTAETRAKSPAPPAVTLASMIKSPVVTEIEIVPSAVVTPVPPAGIVRSLASTNVNSLVPVTVASRSSTSFAPSSVTVPPAATDKLLAVKVPAVWSIPAPALKSISPVPASTSAPRVIALVGSTPVSVTPPSLPETTASLMTRSPAPVLPELRVMEPLNVVTPVMVVPPTDTVSTVSAPSASNENAAAPVISTANVSTLPGNVPVTLSARMARPALATLPPVRSKAAVVESRMLSPAASSAPETSKLPLWATSARSPEPPAVTFVVTSSRPLELVTVTVPSLVVIPLPATVTESTSVYANSPLLVNVASIVSTSLAPLSVTSPDADPAASIDRLAALRVPAVWLISAAEVRLIVSPAASRSLIRTMPSADVVSEMSFAPEAVIVASTVSAPPVETVTPPSAEIPVTVALPTVTVPIVRSSTSAV